MLNKESLYDRLNEGVISERMPAFRRNLKKNLPLIKKYGGLRSVVPLFKDKTVIIAGAGPSLDKALPLLKKYQHRDKIVLISADMALKPLLKAGIRPAFVITCETTPVDYFGGVDTAGIELLAFSCASNLNLRHWKGKFRFYNWLIEEGGYAGLWEKAGRELGSLATGSVVTTQAVSLALGCEIDSLLLCGNDLGFSGSFYCRGTLRHAENIRKTERFNTPDTVDLNAVMRRRTCEIWRDNLKYYSDNQFVTAKMWLEDLFKKTGTRVYDCGEPGCSGPGINRVKLNDFLSGFDRKRKGKRK